VRPRAARRRGAFRVGAATAALGLLALLGCASEPPVEDERTDEVQVLEAIPYSEPDGEELLLNACLPAATDAPTPAIVLIHGGGFEEGDRDSESMMGPCRELAGVGIAGFVIDYRLAPASTYPAQVDDVRAAVEWVRGGGNPTRYGVDPARIGLFGSSAGAIMAASVGADGEGPTDEGSRVAAVVALSPAADLTEAGLDLGDPSESELRLVLQYLGCSSLEDCDVAEPASPRYAVDPSDPPFFIAASEEEIIPIEQAEALRDALEDAGVPVEFQPREGDRHAIRLLDSDMRVRVLEFLRSSLGE